MGCPQEKNAKDEREKNSILKNPIYQDSVVLC